MKNVLNIICLSKYYVIPAIASFEVNFPNTTVPFYVSLRSRRNNHVCGGILLNSKMFIIHLMCFKELKYGSIDYNMRNFTSDWINSSFLKIEKLYYHPDIELSTKSKYCIYYH